MAAGAEAGGYAGYASAQAAMCGVKARAYKPDPARHKLYDELYPLYRTLHDAFGVKTWQDSLYPVMKSLLAIRDRVLAGK